MLPNNLVSNFNYTLSQHVPYELGKKVLQPAYQNTVQNLNEIAERLLLAVTYFLVCVKPYI